MKEYITLTNCAFDSAEIVDKVTSGYVAWNIGHNAPEGYVLFGLRKSYNKEDDGYYHLRADSIKAVKSEHAAELADVIHFAVTPEEAKDFIRKYKDSNDKYRRKGAMKLMAQLDNFKALFH